MSIFLGLLLLATPALDLPDGKAGIGFDDLRFDAAANRLLIPAGRTGNVDLIDVVTQEVSAVGGFARTATYVAGHGQGVTSVDAGEGLLFAADRTARKLFVVEPSQKKILTQVPLASAPDYVRYVAATKEVWVTEPGQGRIEIFALNNGRPSHLGFIAVRGGPESLAIDEKRGRAFTHLWKNKTVAIDLRRHAIVATWPAGCGDPRGIWVDSARGFLLVGCEDGTATALGLDQNCRVLSHVKSGKGVDIIAYDAKRAHLYLPGDESATMAIIAVSDKGILSVLGTTPTTTGAHCATTDQRGNVYVCDPSHGRLLVIADPY
ncbi:MAG TPA: hypothetical protein VGL59_19340 [Polyangia bacterium]|jgi:DNA-binding beta-propeller fold protein YncE